MMADKTLREGWEAAFAAATTSCADDLAPLEFANEFDRDEWTW